MLPFDGRARAIIKRTNDSARDPTPVRKLRTSLSLTAAEPALSPVAHNLLPARAPDDRRRFRYRKLFADSYYQNFVLVVIDFCPI